MYVRSIPNCSSEICEIAFLMVQCKHGPSDGGLIQSLVLKVLSEEPVATASVSILVSASCNYHFVYMHDYVKLGLGCC